MDPRAFYYEDTEEPDDDLLHYEDDESYDDASLDFYDPETHYSTMQLDSSSFDLTSTCIRPTLSDALFEFLLPILLANLISRTLTFFVDQFFGTVLQALEPSKPRLFSFLLLNLKNFIIITSGIGLLAYHFRYDTIGFQLFIFASLLATSFTIPALLTFGPTSQISISILWILSFFLISTNESFIYLFPQVPFIKLRPNIMLIVMKSISYCYLDFTAYLLHPSVLILGVWHPHTPVGPERTWISIPSGILRFVLSFPLCLVFLLVSSCIIDYYLVGLTYSTLFDMMDLYIPETLTNPVQILLLAYSTAIQFHFSHYFICFAAQSMFDLWGFGLPITKPLSIELPRSLVDVVIAWNIPMHHWLKRYVFQPCKRYCGGNMVATIFFTYFISSYLHGFNAQIWSVLLTLGLLTQAEFKLRHRLAHIFSACIESRACEYLSYQEDEEEESESKTRCAKANHQNTGHGWCSLVRLVNTGFTALALINLAFLGSTFDGKPESSNLANIWFIWKSLYFYSHAIALIMFLLYKLI